MSTESILHLEINNLQEVPHVARLWHPRGATIYVHCVRLSVKLGSTRVTSQFSRGIRCRPWAPSSGRPEATQNIIIIPIIHPWAPGLGRKPASQPLTHTVGPFRRASETHGTALAGEPFYSITVRTLRPTELPQPLENGEHSPSSSSDCHNSAALLSLGRWW